MKDQLLLKYLRKCIQEYDLINDGDKIALGISGGKDSMLLATGLSMLQRFYPQHFTLVGITVDPGFGADYSPAAEYLESLGIPLIIEKTDIAEIVFEARKEAHPCSLCANMRRAALTAAAERENCGKLALGHHKDDYLSTLMLSLVYEGKFYTFAPKTDYVRFCMCRKARLKAIPQSIISPSLRTPVPPTRRQRARKCPPLLPN